MTVNISVMCDAEQIAESQPLIGDIEDLSNLEKEFADDEVYLAKIKVSHNSKKRNSFPSHKAHRVALISVSLALSQTPAYTARPRIQPSVDECVKSEMLICLIV